MLVTLPKTGPNRPILLCLSHLRWTLAFQRPHHLLTRAAGHYQVIFVEEPVISARTEPDLILRSETPDVTVATPHLPPGLDPADADIVQRGLLDRLLARRGGTLDVAWYDTPMAFPFAGHLQPRKVVFDVTDQLSAVGGASPRLALLERQLLRRADIVFAGGHNLAEAKRRVHGNVHLFPSSVDADQRRPDTSWDATWRRMHHLIAGHAPSGLPPVPPHDGPAARSAISLLHRSKQPVSRRAASYDWLVVGAGFAGAVMAERLANERGDRVLVIDRREHVGGNAFDHHDAAGVLVHRYGPHIFHTNSDAVVAYLSRFTAWHPYEHRVRGYVDGKLVPVPINLDTVNQLYGLDLTPETLEAWFAARAETVAEIRTSEDVIVSRVGRELYEKFFQGYTRKQWGLDPAQLDASVTARVPVRTNRDDRYFTDKFQAMPRDGYTAMFERLLDQPGIEVRTGIDYAALGDRVNYRRLIWTGPVDEFFDFRYGRLPYRSLRFRHVTHPAGRFQPVGTVNYPMSEDYTRVSEYKHMTGQRHPATSITYEYPAADGDPYYPIPRPENQALYKQYEALADAAGDTWFVGRLATYRYLNMDQVVGQALATFRRIDADCPRTSRAVAPGPHTSPAARAEPG